MPFRLIRQKHYGPLHIDPTKQISKISSFEPKFCLYSLIFFQHVINKILELRHITSLHQLSVEISNFEFVQLRDVIFVITMWTIHGEEKLMQCGATLLRSVQHALCHSVTVVLRARVGGKQNESGLVDKVHTWC